MTLFVDTSVFFAAADEADSNHVQAARIVMAGEALVTSDHVVVESWLIMRSRLGRPAADRFLSEVRRGAARMEMIVPGDFDVASAIADQFPDQDFSIVDRTSFAVMQRLGILRAASFDDDFAIFRFGPRRDRAFEVVR